MIKIEASTLEDAYARAAAKLTCSVTQLQVEIVQYPTKGFLGIFQKNAVIVARCIVTDNADEAPKQTSQKACETIVEDTPAMVSQERVVMASSDTLVVESVDQVIYNDTIMPESFVTDQKEEAVDIKAYEDTDVPHRSNNIDTNFFEDKRSVDEIAQEIDAKINALFAKICFDIDTIKVSAYDSETILVEFTGKDAALLIGKEGYRYKALSYMIFNWINSEYNMQLRLEIAEFLKNQEESISRYLVSVIENVDRDGRAQTKVLDGVLVQIALKQLRDTYPDKYVAIRSTRDGLKFIIINDYNNY
ncbi:MAG: protein jag [Sulfurimonas sp.]|nr:MAG: protein jag [Sulfurimonas sp.]